MSASEVHFFHLRCALHDEREARRDVATHQRLDRLIRESIVLTKGRVDVRATYQTLDNLYCPSFTTGARV